MAASPPDEKLTFVQSFEGLFERALKDEMTPALKKALRGVGVNLDAPLAPQYPASVFRQSVRVTADVLYPGESHATSYRALGTRFVAGYFKTLAGRTVLPLLKLVGPMQSLKRLTKSLRTGNNYSDARITVVGEREVTVWVNDAFGDDDPGFGAGILEHGHALVGGRNAKVTVLSFERPPEAMLRVTWDK